MNIFLPASSKDQARVAFGTTLNRELLPLKTPHTRAGNELGLRGVPNLGPGAYDNHQVSSFTYALEQRPVCKRGYSLGARTASRFQKEINGVPGPPSYQAVISQPREFSPALKPFQCGASRLPDIRKDPTPGPGSYEHNVGRNRKVQFLGSFGGPQTLKSSVTLICHNGEPDICCACGTQPKGDYLRSRMEALCRPCYHSILESDNAKVPLRYLESFRKVRDCREMHAHEGTNAKLRLMNEKEIKKLRLKEAYMSLYYN